MTARPATAGRLSVKIFPPLPPGEAPSFRQRSEVRGQRSEGIVTRPRLNNPHALTIRRSPLFHPRHPRNPRLIFAVINHPHAFSTRRSPLFQTEVRRQRSEVRWNLKSSSPSQPSRPYRQAKPSLPFVFIRVHSWFPIRAIRVIRGCPSFRSSFRPGRGRPMLHRFFSIVGPGRDG